MQDGVGIHLYVANASMHDRFFYNADGEMLILPQQGRLLLRTELGILEVAPGESGVIPRGIKFRAELPDGTARGYICENYGQSFRLPDLGPIGANGLANRATSHAGRGLRRSRRRVSKSSPNSWAAVARGDRPLAARRRRLARQLRALQVRHGALQLHQHGQLRPPRPVHLHRADRALGLPGTANVDFVIFPPRWMVAEHTFRPPWFHRNMMNEFMGLILGQYDAKAEGFLPGGASLHNCMSGHGPDAETFERASKPPS
jgi:homogentisate 1,2-dioxygenase